MPRISKSPELLQLAGKQYNVFSDCARTYIFAGGVVAWSWNPHINIINGLRSMSGPGDRKAMKDYGFQIAGKLTQADLDHFLENWSGTLGDTRRNNKAGRVWLDVPDDDANRVNVISFWAHRASTDAGDVETLRKVFKISGGVWVDWDDCAESTWFPAET